MTDKRSATIIRPGAPADIDTLYTLVEELAVHHQHDPDYIDNSPAQMRDDAFGPDRHFRFFVAEVEGEIIGAAIYYFTYSTWKGKTLYLEDLIITRAARGRGVGQKLMHALAEAGVAAGARKMKWQVAEDNAAAVRFYERLDADLDPAWINCELSYAQLAELSEGKLAVTA
ncbi:MAG: GNAT family N-acetyltransferase [Catalinimonas sp.]